VPLFRRFRAGDSPLVAAAKTLEKADGTPQEPGKVQGWQVEVYDLIDNVPEGGYVTTFMGDCFSRVTLGVGRRNDAGDVEEVEPDNTELAGPLKAATQALHDFQAPVGGQAQLLRSVGVNLFAGGEFYLVMIPDADLEVVPPNPGEAIAPDLDAEVDVTWEVLSVHELGSTGSGDKMRYTRKGGTGKDEELPAGTTAHRVWLPDFRYSRQARSSLKGVRRTLTKMQLLDQHEMADLMSRLNAGVLLIPSEGKWPNRPGQLGGFPGFVQRFIETMTAPIKDPGSAAAITPNMVEFKGELIEKWRHLDLARSNPYEGNAKRDGFVEELARGVQMPVGIVKGMGSDNHWSAWLEDESLVKSHLEPLLELGITDGCSSVYLRPVMIALGVAEDEADRWVLTFDASELVGHPDQSKDAVLLYDRGELTGKTLRSATGFTEGDAPDAGELERRKQLAAIVGKPGQAGAPGAGGPAGVEPGAPASSSSGEGDLAHRLADATEVAIGRAVERAGNRLRNKANGRPGVRDLLAATPPHEVAVSLGPALVATLGGADELFLGEFGHLARTARRWAHQAGHADPAVVAERTMELAEVLARRRLYDPELSPSPADFALVLVP
jgi:hypothetical protein